MVEDFRHTGVNLETNPTEPVYNYNDQLTNTSLSDRVQWEGSEVVTQERRQTYVALRESIDVTDEREGPYKKVVEKFYWEKRE